MNKLISNLAWLCLLIGGCPADDKHEADDEVVADATNDAGAGSSSSSASDRADLEQRNVSKLKECGLYESEGDLDQYRIQDSFDVCVAECTVNATCAQLRQVVCDARENAFTDCFADCEASPSDGFACKDGARIPHAALCDQQEDCAGGEDEQECGVLTCDDGEVIAASSARCDWVEDCADGSDELGCALRCP